MCERCVSSRVVHWQKQRQAGQRQVPFQLIFGPDVRSRSPPCQGGHCPGLAAIFGCFCHPTRGFLAQCPVAIQQQSPQHRLDTCQNIPEPSGLAGVHSALCWSKIRRRLVVRGIERPKVDNLDPHPHLSAHLWCITPTAMGVGTKTHPL